MDRAGPAERGNHPSWSGGFPPDPARIGKQRARTEERRRHGRRDTGRETQTTLEVLVYDYIVVGAGSAGSVVAARLSEDPSTSVLVLEGGPADDLPEIAMPAAAPMLWSGPLTWDNVTVRQRHAAQREIPWPTGRVLGGSSSINGMLYVRGNRVDYDTWRDAYGCVGWGYRDLLPYFLRAEDQQRGASPWHGTGGPLRVEDQRFEHPLSRAWLEAAVASGLPRNEDFNGADQDGVGHYQVTQRAGRRWSVADAYLRPAMRRPNLTVETGAHVSRLLLDGDRVTGVRYLRDGAACDAAAAREVVVAGGAVRTPQLLLLSGIGPADQLRAHDIPVAVDAPAVGVGLHDHPMCLPGWRTPATPNLWEEATPENLERWRRERRGPMASFGAEAGGFARSRGDRPAPDLQFGAIPGPPPLPGLGPPTERAVGTLVGAVHPRSRGTVTLASADPMAKPAVDPAYFADEADLDVLVAGVRVAREIAACQPLAAITAGEIMPGEDLDDDEQLRDWVRATAGTMFHPTGTCAMGGGADAVCDPDLRVRGVEGLRVVDASVMPVTPRGNTNAPTIAVAERAADLIRGGAALPPAAPERELV
jgi:choline dehydrogenase